MNSDLEIAQANPLQPITEVAEAAGIPQRYLELYGMNKAKVDLGLFTECENQPDGKLILVTALTPTPAGEGKTTVTVGLGDALAALGKRTFVALREPSMGPVFGIKGGAAGGGYAQVVPMEDINLHFTGDMHAVGAANNLLAALLDNHVHQGNGLNIDVRRIVWRRAVDMNDRQLRFIVDGLGGTANGVAREDGFEITVASEIMAILCLARDLNDLKERLARIIVAYTYDGKPVTAADLRAAGALAAVLKDALKPNLVQTLEHTPAFVHGGPFANIAHGCNSLLATRMALKLGEYAVTEAGFGADLGAEKFLDIKCRIGDLHPAAVVIVATIRALKHHGGIKPDQIGREDVGAVGRGVPNLAKHIRNITQGFGLPAVVAINRFPRDTEAELALVVEACADLGVKAIVTEVWAKGSQGGIAMAEEVIRLCRQPNDFRFVYGADLSLEKKIDRIAKAIYGASGVDFTPEARRQLRRYRKLGFQQLPVCMAKTQYSLSDDPKKLGEPQDFRITVRSVRVAAGAGFVVALTGDIMTMPGLPKTPAAESIDIDRDGKITGLF